MKDAKNTIKIHQITMSSWEKRQRQRFQAFFHPFLRIFVGRDALVHSAAGHLLSSRVGFSVADDNFRTSAIILEYDDWMLQYWYIIIIFQ